MDDRTGSVNTAGDDTEARARELRAEIDQTRDDLSETVEAIQEKLRPGNVIAAATSAATGKVKHMASDAATTAEEYWDYSGGTTLVDRIKSNPVPAVLAGVGLAWLAMSDGGHRRYRPVPPQDYRPASGAGRRAAPQSYESSRHQSNGMEGMRHAVRRSGNSLLTAVRDYPLAMGAAAAIVGAAIGVAVPETDRENELMGETKEAAMHKAQDAVGGAVDRAKEAAADVVSRAAIGG